MDVQLSETEQIFVVHGVQENFRNDGRSNGDYRPIILETDLINNTSGSARVRLGNTDVLVGVKAEIGVPSTEMPDSGQIKFFVDCSANATPEFEGRGGEELGQDIALCLTTAFNSKNALDLTSLCIVKQKLCWILYVDVVVLECGGGNVYDCASLAVKSALFDLKISKAKPIFSENGKVDFELSDDSIYDIQRLNVADSPILVTVGKIGVDTVVDMSAEEEKCRKSSLVVGVVGRNNKVTDNCRISLVKQTGGGGSLDPDSIDEMVEMAVKCGVNLNDKLFTKLCLIEKRPKPEIYGFLS